MTQKKINVKNFFERGFDNTDFINANELELPKDLVYMSHDELEGKYGMTNRYIFKDPKSEADGQQIRLLNKGLTFKKAIEKYVSVGGKITLSKNDRGFWIFDLPK